MNKPLVISFSGGKTSAYMAVRLKAVNQGRKLITVFANTGQEREETLRFVDAVDKAYGLNVVWLEAKVTHENRIGTAHTVVNFDTADRLGVVFEEVIKKYGIPNVAWLHCTRELKQQPIKSYLRSIGLVKGSYDIAIGIRADEKSRVNEKKAKVFSAVYPMIEWDIEKADVNSYWNNQPFTLELKEHQGNCTWCYKKTDLKHAKLVHEDVSIYDFPRRMEQLYQKSDKRVFFRKNRNTDQHIQFVQLLDITKVNEIPEQLDFGLCQEHCEPFM